MDGMKPILEVSVVVIKSASIESIRPLTALWLDTRVRAVESSDLAGLARPEVGKSRTIRSTGPAPERQRRGCPQGRQKADKRSPDPPAVSNSGC
jgi:hypothetical protein